MLPTEKESLLYRIHSRANNETVLGYGADVKKDLSLKPQHLYLISNDKIKEGDWVYNVLDNIVCEHKGLLIPSDSIINYKKVIASTDPKLINRQKEWGMAVMYSTSKEGTEHWFTTYDMPTFSEDFIKAYVKANGIDEVMVRYEDGDMGELHCLNCGHSEFHCNNEEGCDTLSYKEGPMSRDNNEVIISMVEKKMYSRDEVVGLLMKASKDRAIQHREGFNKWIEENL